MEVIISDVTNMTHDVICVAGWCPAENRMIRPLSGYRRHWPAAMATPELFAQGNVVAIEPAGLSGGRGMPHAHEDTVVAPGPQLLRRLDGDALANSLAPSLSRSVDAAFGGCVVARRFVPAGSDCPSLGAVLIRPRRTGFEIRKRQGRPDQIRCWFYVGEDKSSYNLPVVSRQLNAVFNSSGTEGLHNLGAGKSWCHLRLGLATPRANPMKDADQAYIMVNGMIFC